MLTVHTILALPQKLTESFQSAPRIINGAFQMPADVMSSIIGPNYSSFPSCIFFSLYVQQKNIACSLYFG